MVVLRLWFLLLLTLCSSKDFSTKIVGRETEVTPVCDSSKAAEFITLLVCKVSRERSSAEPCILIYQYDGQGYKFEQGCGSNFTLIGNNQTVFLRHHQLPADRWNITCYCSHGEGTYIHHLNITVEDPEKEEKDLATANGLYASISVTLSLFLTTVVLVLICRKWCRRKRRDSQRNPPDMADEDVGPYSTFIHTDSGLYSVVQLH